MKQNEQLVETALIEVKAESQSEDEADKGALAAGQGTASAMEIQGDEEAATAACNIVACYIDISQLSMKLNFGKFVKIFYF